MRRFGRKCVSLLLLSVLLSAAAMPAAAADGGAGVGWSDGEEGFAVRITSYGGEVSRVTAGERFSVQLWISGSDPAAVSVPLSWNPSIAAVVDENTGQPVSTGRKTENDLVRGAGFRPGETCYDNSLNDDYEPLYWNGKPVFTKGDGTGAGAGTDASGYPYINNETGFAKFLYYTNAPTKGSKPQMFLEVSFLALAPGDPNLHFATAAADGPDTKAFDPGSPKGLQASFTDRTDGNIDDVDRVESEVYTGKTPFPAFRVTDGSEMDKEPTVPPDGGGGTPPAQGGSAAGAQPKPEEAPKPPAEAVMKQAVHLSTWPADYGKPAECTARLKRSDKETIWMTDEYDIEEAALYAAVAEAEKSAAAQGKNAAEHEKGTAARENAAPGRPSAAVLIRLPEQIIAKDEYAVSVPAGPLGEAAKAGIGQLYLETPWGYIGLECGPIAGKTKEGSVVRVSVKAVSTGLQGSAGASDTGLQGSAESRQSVTLSLKIDGAEAMSFDGPALRVLLPYSVKEGEQAPAVFTDRAFGSAGNAGTTGAAGMSAPLAVSRYDGKSKLLIVQAPAGGTVTLKNCAPKVFTDLNGVLWAKEDIDRLSRLEIVSGTGAGRFGAEERVTREQFAKMVTAAFGLYEVSPGMPFSDIDKTNPFYYYIGSAASKEIVSGVEKSRFDGESSISRQDLAQIVCKACRRAGVQLPSAVSVPVFQDDAQIAPYAKDAVYALARAGVISGTGDGRFSPEGFATRAEAARILGAVSAMTEQLL